MSVDDIRKSLSNRLQPLALEVSESQKLQLATYLWLLAKWNRTINLTSLDVDPPSDDAIDRLIVEPLLAAKLLNTPVGLLVDLGTGGGSPAIPFSIATHAEHLVMVESRARKCAFLREVSRQLGLKGAEVENARIEAASQRMDLQRQADAVTVRAVRADQEFFAAASNLVRPGGQLFWFGSAGQPPPSPAAGLIVHSTHDLLRSAVGGHSVLTLFQKG